MPSRRSLLLHALLATASLAGNPRAGPARAAPEIRVSIDLVEAMKLVLEAVRDILGASDAARQRRAREAVPRLAQELVRIAAAKDQIAALPGLPPTDAAKRAEALAREIRASLARLPEWLKVLDPDWTARNIETLGLLYAERHARGVTAEALARYAEALPLRADGPGSPAPLPEDFFSRQREEAEALRRLAAALAASVAERP